VTLEKQDSSKTELRMTDITSACRTHTATVDTAIGVAVCSRGLRANCYRTATLVNLLSEAKAKGQLQSFMKQIEKRIC